MLSRFIVILNTEHPITEQSYPEFFGFLLSIHQSVLLASGVYALAMEGDVSTVHDAIEPLLRDTDYLVVVKAQNARWSVGDEALNDRLHLVFPFVD